MTVKTAAVQPIDERDDAAQKADQPTALPVQAVSMQLRAEQIEMVRRAIRRNRETYRSLTDR